MKSKIFTAAPLSFTGQKKRFLKAFKVTLNDYSPTATYVDLFGGSGLLSHTIKSIYPNAHVIYNDYDNYCKRLRNINITNCLLADIRGIIGSISKHERLSEVTKEKIIKKIESQLINSYVDWITISASLLFQNKFAFSLDELKKSTMYNNVRQTDYDASGYLDGLTVVSKDYRKLFDAYKDCDNVVFVVDPPYLSTLTIPYTMSWKLADYLDVLQVLEGYNYFFFTSNKSSIIELCEWIGAQTIKANPFKDAKMHTTQNTINYSSTYTDIMLYKNE